MKVIKKSGKNFRDDLLKSKAMDIEKYNVSTLISMGTAFFMLNSTPLWPISEKVGINRSNPIKNVCNTLPTFIHKNSRQGEEWPAKGNMFGFQAPGPDGKPMNHDDRMFLDKCSGGRQKSTEISLPRCRTVVEYGTRSGHISFLGVLKQTFSACTNSPSCTGKIEKVAVLVNIMRTEIPASFRFPR